MDKFEKFTLMTLMLCLIAVFILSLSVAYLDRPLVLRVLDGDTIEVSRGGSTKKIDLAGITAPSLNGPCPDKARKVRMMLENRILGQRVTIAYPKGGNGSAAHVFLGRRSMSDWLRIEGVVGPHNPGEHWCRG